MPRFPNKPTRTEMPPGRRSWVIINATSIGARLNGLGVYALQLLLALAALPPVFHFLVFVNRRAGEHLEKHSWPENVHLRWVSGALSPDYGFAGHLRRLIFANYLGFRYRHFPLFTTSQLEVSFSHPDQIITIHDLIPLLFPETHQRQYPFFKYLLPRAIRQARRIIVPSRHTRDQIIIHYPVPAQAIQVIYPGPGLHQCVPPPSPGPQREKFILFLGRLSPTKNLSPLLEAFLRLRERRFRLLVVGDGEQPVQSQRARSDRFPGVHFTGYLDCAAVHDLYRRASFFVFPSLHEGFGFPPLEAMAHRCPVLASAGGSLGEVLGSAVRYMDPTRPEQIAGAMRMLMENEALREDLSHKGYRHVNRFSWQKSARQHLTLFEQIWGYRLPFTPGPVRIHERCPSGRRPGNPAFPLAESWQQFTGNIPEKAKRTNGVKLNGC